MAQSDQITWARTFLTSVLVGAGLVIGIVSGIVTILGALTATNIVEVDLRAIIEIVTNPDDFLDRDLLRAALEKYLAAP